MIRRSHKRTARALVLLCSLWMLSACSQATTRHRQEPAEQPPGVQAPSASAAEVPVDIETSAHVSPGLPTEAESPASLPPGTPGGARPASMKPEPGFYVHVVRWQGETLSLIAQWYTLSWLNWETIAAANPGMDPKRIAIGNRVRIPEGLLKRRVPMPFDSLPSSSTRKGIVPPSPARAVPEKPADKAVPEPDKPSEKPGALPEEPELFGPQEADGGQLANTPEKAELFGPGEIAGGQGAVPEDAELFGPVE